MDQSRIARDAAHARQRIASATIEAARALSDIAKLQALCKHVFLFSWQVNALHEHLWYITYKCRVCEAERTEEKRPVCPSCEMTLRRAGKKDAAAQKEAAKPEYQGSMNPPIPFRCPRCKAIHILWHVGD